MTISEIMQKMIAFSNGNRHDINHLLKVWGYAKTIGDTEKLDADTQFLLETAAITHDIACPLCREKYGNTNDKYQEAEGSRFGARLFGGYRPYGKADRPRFLPCRTSSHAVGCFRCGLSNPHRSGLSCQCRRKRLFGGKYPKLPATIFSRRKPARGC